MRARKVLAAVTALGAIGVLSPVGTPTAYADDTNCTGSAHWCATTLACTAWDATGKCIDVSVVDYHCTICGET